MNPLYIKNLRDKLQKRVSRLNTVDANLFGVTLAQFWRFFEEQPIYVGILEELIAQLPQLDDIIDNIKKQAGVVGNTEEEAAAIGYKILKYMAEKQSDYSHKLYLYAHKYNRLADDEDKAVATIRQVFLEPFYEYVDEHLDDQRTMLSLLIRYKHRSEWFQKDTLWDLSQETQVGEKNLAQDLYGYLYDQGIDFMIETSSIRGEIDLIAAQKTDDPLLLDAKIFDGEHSSKTHICKGFNQIYTYTQHYNEPFGYLVIYKTTEYDLKFTLPLSQFSNIPIVVYNYKTIFLIVVDIFQYHKPVSQRKPIRSIEITYDDLVTTANAT